jgi:hypothetical protein
MRGLTVVGGTLLAMVAAAGVGAFIAAHSTERDAPSVGATTGSQHSASPSVAETEHWSGVMTTDTTRGYRSGGTCSTAWRTPLRVAVDPGGAASGDGTAVLTSGPNCPFVTGQPQVRRFDVAVRGQQTGDRLSLRLAATTSRDGIDYGGFDEAFAEGRTVTLNVSNGLATNHDVIRVVPADPTDTAVVRNSIRLRLDPA